VSVSHIQILLFFLALGLVQVHFGKATEPHITNGSNLELLVRKTSFLLGFLEACFEHFWVHDIVSVSALTDTDQPLWWWS
jgi:hypothetical protein